MEYSDSLVMRSRELVNLIKEAEKQNKPIENLVKEQIAIMECQKDEFIRRSEDMQLDEIAKARTEIQMYNNIKFWAQKIGLPIDKYDKLIDQVKIKIFGEDNYQIFPEQH